MFRTREEADKYDQAFVAVVSATAAAAFVSAAAAAAATTTTAAAAARTVSSAASTTMCRLPLSPLLSGGSFVAFVLFTSLPLSFG